MHKNDFITIVAICNQINSLTQKSEILLIFLFFLDVINQYHYDN